MGEGEHADVAVVVVVPVGEGDQPVELGHEVLPLWSGSFLEIVALVCGVEPEDVLLLEDLEVVKHDDHPHGDVFLPVVEEEHEVDFDVLDGVAQSSRVFCLALELLSRLDPADHPDHVDDRQMLLLQNAVNSLKLARQRREEYSRLGHDLGVLVECYLQLSLLGDELDLTSSQQVVVADHQVLSGGLHLRHKVDTLHLRTHLVRNDEVSSEKAVLTFHDRKVVDSAKNHPARRSLKEILQVASLPQVRLELLLPMVYNRTPLSRRLAFLDHARSLSLFLYRALLGFAGQFQGSLITLQVNHVLPDGLLLW